MVERDRLLRLRHGAYELELCPELGGCITRFRHRQRDLFRPAGPAYFARGDAREAASFPLVPYSGRIADARLVFEGQTFELARNFPPEPHSIHGHGWQNPWTVEQAGEAAAALAFQHRVAGTPFDYRARQRFALGADGLDLGIEVTNLGAGPMPAGIGHHPYFVRTAGVTLTARLDHVWLADQRNIPERRAPLPESWDFTRAPRVADLVMDNGFGGWDGRAELHWPETATTLRIEAEPLFGHLVIYIPPGADFFCVEPVSNANDGFNLFARGVADTGVRVLAPGETLAGRIRFQAA